MLLLTLLAIFIQSTEQTEVEPVRCRGKIFVCLVNPCSIVTFTKVPGAVCRPDYCQGCNVRFFRGTRDVTSRCGRRIPHVTCPRRRPVHNCLMDPCKVAQCPKYHNARCRADYCGGCRARFYYKKREVTQECKVNRRMNQYNTVLSSDCPEDEIWHCIEDPCDKAKCPNYPMSVCKQDCCGGCKARFFEGRERFLKVFEVTDKCHGVVNGGCPPDKPVVACLVQPCKFAKCRRFPNARCEDDYCGGCRARWFIGKNEVTKNCDDDGGPGNNCPNGKVWHCVADPCKVNSCPKYPDATCKSDYCRGCDAYYFVDGDEVTEDCHNTNHGGCPPDRPEVVCKTSPCEISKCPRHQNAQCFDDYCGQCQARWFVGDKEVTNTCFNVLPSNECVNGETRVLCFRDPCGGRTCTIKGAECVSDYCGGCHERWFVRQSEVTASCKNKPPNSCENGKDRVACFEDPCSLATCSNVVGATCRSDYCGGCFARWFVGSQEVTESCSGAGTGTCLTKGCQNDGMCVRSPVGYICDCVSGFDGEFCEINSGSLSCVGNQCKNGATCEVQPGGYVCNCASGFTGEYCETNAGTGSCVAKGCQNGGTCVRSSTGYRCDCVSGFDGEFCEINSGSESCVGNQCKNGATCEVQPGGYICNCASGFTGEYCETNTGTGNCVGNLCQNGATCVPLPYLYKCNCATGYTGEFCQGKETPSYLKCKYGRLIKGGNPVTCAPMLPNSCPSGFFCSGGPADQPGPCCLTQGSNICPSGDPYAVEGDAPTCTGPADCPTGFECKSNGDPLNSVSVCCPKTGETSDYLKCKYGRLTRGGSPVTCAPMMPNSCPSDFFCSGGPADQPGPCCLLQANNICPGGDPYTVAGDAPTCTGPADCPTGFLCQSNENPFDSVSVCCPITAETPDYLKCKYGRLIQGGSSVTCAPMTPNSCPSGFFCSGGPADQPGPCCLSKASNLCGPDSDPYSINGEAQACTGPNNLRCLPGFVCKTNNDSVNFVSVCCPIKNPETPDYLKCKYGRLVKDGSTVMCAPMVPNTCPSGFFCSGGPVDQPGPCCLREESNLCKSGDPLEEGGDAKSCGGDNDFECPPAFECKTRRGLTGQVSVCCEGGTKPKRKPKCRYAKYFKDVGKNPTCLQSAISSCPPAYECTTLRKRKPGYCCLKENPCLKGEPWRKKGDSVNCLGIGKRDCPKGYECVGSPQTFSACCRITWPKKCSKLHPDQNCQVNLCKVTYCSSNKNAKCIMNTCGHCKAQWYDGKKKVTKACQTTQPICPEDKPIVNCLADPCMTAVCTKKPHATCFADYCGGCNARFFIDLEEVTKDC